MATRKILLAASLAGMTAAFISGCGSVEVAPARASEHGYVLIPTDTPSAEWFRSAPVPVGTSDSADAEPREAAAEQAAAQKFEPGVEPPPGALAEAPIPGGWLIYQKRCAGCHGGDGTGKTLGDGTVVPDLVLFGAARKADFVYDPEKLEQQLGASGVKPAERLEVVAKQLAALQEGFGKYARKGKKVVTPLQWFKTVCGDEEVTRESMHGVTAGGREKWRYHWDTSEFQSTLRPEENAVFNTGTDLVPTSMLEMPMRRPLTQQQRWDAVYYLWALSVDVQSARTGGQLFQENCNVCHGKRTRGDGPLAPTMEPRPRNFQNFVWLSDKANQRLYTSIAKGRVYTAMPPWEDRLTEDQIWRIVEYLRTWNYKYPYDWVERQD